MKKSSLVLGIACGIAATAWVLSRGDDDEAEASERLERVEEKPRGGSRWLPWQRSSGVEIAPEVVKIDARYEGEWVEVPVHVLDVHGQPISGADVEVRAWAEEWTTVGMTDEQYDAWSEAQPEVDYEEEEYVEEQMVVVATGRTDRKGTFRARVKPEVEIVFSASEGAREGMSFPYYAASAEYMEEGEEVATVTIEIGEVASLVAYIRDEAGNPIPNAWLDLYALDTEASMESIYDVIVTKDEHHEDALTSNEEGVVDIKLRAWGAFEITVEADGKRRHVEPVVQLFPGRKTELNITLESTAEYAGIVLDEQGNPVAGAALSAVTSEGDTAANAYTNADGSFAIDVEDPSNILRVVANGFRMAVVPIASASTIRLSRGGSLSVTVSVTPEVLASSSGTASIYLAAPDGDVKYATGDSADAYVISRNERFFNSVRLDENGQGVVTVAGLPPGTFRLTVTAGGAVAIQQRVTVYDGSETSAVARIPDANAASLGGVVHASRPVYAGSLYLSAAGAMSLHAKLAPGGAFRFEAVPAGEWTLAGSVELDGAWTHIDPVVVQIGIGEHRTIEVEANAQVMTPVAYGGDGEYLEDPEADPERFVPDVTIEELESGMVVMRSGDRRLFGGDRITSIDGTNPAAANEDGAYELLVGPEGTTCRIIAVRPATGETITVSLKRSRAESEYY